MKATNFSLSISSPSLFGRYATRNLAGKWREMGERLYLGSTSIARAEMLGEDS